MSNIKTEKNMFIYHTTEAESKGSGLGKRRATFSGKTIVENGKNYLLIAAALTSEKDSFCKKTGVRISSGRLEKGLVIHKVILDDIELPSARRIFIDECKFVIIGKLLTFRKQNYHTLSKQTKVTNSSLPF